MCPLAILISTNEECWCALRAAFQTRDPREAAVPERAGRHDVPLVKWSPGSGRTATLEVCESGPGKRHRPAACRPPARSQKSTALIQPSALGTGAKTKAMPSAGYRGTPPYGGPPEPIAPSESLGLHDAPHRTVLPWSQVGEESLDCQSESVVKTPASPNGEQVFTGTPVAFRPSLNISRADSRGIG
jgi:hypothetical protein